MRVFVTGGGRGFLARHVVGLLAEAGHEVRSDWVDIRDGGRLTQAIEGCEAVVHVAALYSYTAPAAELEAVNVAGTGNVIAACRAAGVARLVHTSTAGTCGPVAGRVATEEDGPPDWELAVPYKRTKLAAERLVLAAAADGLDAVCLNPTTPIGEGDDDADANRPDGAWGRLRALPRDAAGRRPEPRRRARRRQGPRDRARARPGGRAVPARRGEPDPARGVRPDRAGREPAAAAPELPYAAVRMLARARGWRTATRSSSHGSRPGSPRRRQGASSGTSRQRSRTPSSGPSARSVWPRVPAPGRAAGLAGLAADSRRRGSGPRRGPAAGE